MISIRNSRCGAFAIIASLATTASAEVFEYSCGNVEFNLNLTTETLSDRFRGERRVEWTYREGVVLWRESSDDFWSGINIRTGAMVADGKEDAAAGCIVSDPQRAHHILSAQSEIPSDVASTVVGPLVAFSLEEIEREFMLLSRQHRMGVQRLLVEIYGREIGQVDGLWGPRTGNALYEMQIGFANRGWAIEGEGESETPSRYTDFLVRLASYYAVL